MMHDSAYGVPKMPQDYNSDSNMVVNGCTIRVRLKQAPQQPPRISTETGEHDLDQLCLANIARFKRPKAYVFLASLPKNNYGKVLKTELRERVAASAGPASSGG